MGTFTHWFFSFIIKPNGQEHTKLLEVLSLTPVITHKCEHEPCLFIGLHGCDAKI